MLRITLVMTFLIVFFILSIPVFLFEWIIGKINMNIRNRTSYFIVRIAFKIVLFISGTHITVKGFENIIKDTPVLYVGNHNSYFDIVISGSVIPYPTGYVSKKEMIKFPFLRIWMYLINCVFIDRDNPRQGLKTILKGIDKINSGISMFIFPEGTRSKDGKMTSFKEGSMKMAQKSGCPIIPVAFTNTSSVFEKQFPKIKSSDVTIEFGKPIYTSELSKEEQKSLGSKCKEEIQKMLDAV
ncbi:MAG: 1-acyl-sn-glycerol-3-phosphate acyltransferase [Lachnospiraceae bacterium]|nr:1-acyl-sn-glycerol-3-phosphate acyltransferase [Lachnospiraceae bacterium]